MDLAVCRKPGRLPERFPVGTTYVVEGRGGEDGQLRVFSRYVVLPSGRRIQVTDDFGGLAARQARRTRRAAGTQAQNSAKRPPARAQKSLAPAGTTGRHRR